MAGKDNLFGLIGEAVWNRLSGQSANTAQNQKPYPSPLDGYEVQSRPVPYPDWQGEINNYLAGGSVGPMPYSWGAPDTWDQGHMRWGYGDAQGNPQKYGKYAGSYGGPEDPTIYRQFLENGQRVWDRGPK